MPVYPVGTRHGVLGLLHPLHILGQIEDDGLRRQLLWRSVSMFLGGDPGGSVVPHHLQCDGGCSGVSLGITGGGRRGMSGRVG